MCVACVWHVCAPFLSHVCALTHALSDLGGSIPRAILNTRIKGTLSTILEWQDHFERNLKVVDRELRDAAPPPPPLSSLDPDQSRLITDCLLLQQHDTVAKWRPLAFHSPAVEMRINYGRNKKERKKGERSVATGRAVARIDVPAQQALSWFIAYNSRERVRISLENGNPARFTASENTAHDIVVATIKRMSFPFQPREFVCRIIAAENTHDNTLLLATESVGDVIDYGMRCVLGVGTRERSGQISLTHASRVYAYASPTWRQAHPPIK